MAGAPLDWNSAGLAEALDRQVQREQLERFESRHIEILYGCLEREIDENRLETWLKIYKDLQKYIFISLTDLSICDIAASIVKKFFGNKALSELILPLTRELFLKIVVSIYEPDIGQAARENFLALFTYLIEEGDAFKEYIFQILKQYSERHKAAFLKSNLVEFTNDLARARRVKLYGLNSTDSLSF